MILILTIDNDISVDRVEEWLLVYQGNYLRVNSGGFNRGLRYIEPFSNTVFEFDNDVRLDARNVNVVYNRKWFPNEYLNRIAINDNKDWSLVDFLKRENNEFNYFFFNALNEAKWINTHKASGINKLDQMLLAIAVGLRVPDSIVTSEKAKVAAFFEKHNGKIITKSLVARLNIKFDGDSYANYTTAVDEAFLSELPERFHHSLFQECIVKQFEIRVFYLDGKFYSVAYFTEQDDLSFVDYRLSYRSPTFRTEVFNLPQEVKDKLKTFMQRANLITGSFDIIYSINGEFVFVEVNPSGIFDNVSAAGNFNIEKEFAKMLIKYDRQAQKRKAINH